MPYSVKLPPVSHSENPSAGSPIPEKPVTAVTTGNIPPVSDPLTHLVTTKLSDLRAPLEVSSTILGETIWVVANDSQAAKVRAKGDTPYTPEELAILKELAASVSLEVWAKRVRLIHAGKRDLDGTVLYYLRPDPKARLWHVLSEWASLEEAKVTPEEVDRLKAEIMDLFRDCPEAENWHREWREMHPGARLC